MKIAKLHLNFAKISSKKCQILIERFLKGQRSLTVCQRGEFSPNLVTLIEEEIYFKFSSWVTAHQRGPSQF